jgi:hypothetical protein
MLVVSGIDSNPPTEWDEKREKGLAAREMREVS